MSVKVITANIEGHRHFEERLLPFVLTEKPEFISFQEVFEVDVPVLKQKLGMEGQYLPLANITETSIHMSHALGSWGIAQLSSLPIVDSGFEYYQGNREYVPDFRPDSDPNSMNRALSWMTVEKEGQEYTFVTTHFIWTPNGDPTELQHQKLADIWRILEPLKSYVLMGDFNAPRGRAIFTEMASKLKDNVPPEVTTSIDGSLHKAGNLELMVDGMFSTPDYILSHVRVESGVSDHKVIVAEVSKH